jgi:UDP-2-acetamido-2,6-beta-L-arabino-hexul-4-ose reductase
MARKIGITGIDGLIGWHLRSFLHGQKDVVVVGADKPEFASPELLKKFAVSCEVIVHLAGMNRGDDAEVAATNVALTEQLLAACDAAGARPHIIFSSSTHIYRGTPYGNSKKRCAELIKAWADGHKTAFTNFVLPNIFGESGKPFYNSAVSTFCYQLANGQKPEIIKDIEVELLHARHVAREVYSVILKPVNGELVPKGHKILVSQLLAKLEAMAGLYSSNIVPDLRQELDLDLFNTYRSYLFPAKTPGSLELKKDTRGYLFEAAKSPNGGQTFISSTMPGITRGNHYHTRKFERFLVIKGKACIRVRKLFSGDTHEFHVDGEKPQFVDMPALHTHNITNTGDSELLTLFWTSEIFDPADSDTYQETV